MSSKTLSIPLIRHIVKRGYAQAVPNSALDQRLEMTKVSNQTLVCALDNECPVSRVTVAFKAGSRYEPWCELGLTHVLRSAAGFTTGHLNGFIISRKLAQLGASVSCSGDREFIYYTLEATQDNLSDSMDVFQKMICAQQFRPWELDDNAQRLKYDIISIPPQVRAMDLLHKAAFRRGLGNSLFLSPRKIGQVSSESLQHFVSNTFAPNRCAVAVVGQSIEQAKAFASTLNTNAKGDCPAEPAKYLSGEYRKEMGGELAHVAIGLEGAAASHGDSLALAVAAKALGCGPMVKWGVSNAPLTKAMGNIGPCAAAGFNVSYSDAGLFGVILSVPKDEATHAVKAAAKLLKSGTLSDDAIKVGKSQLKMQILSDADSGSALSETLAAEALYTGAVKSPLAWAEKINALTSSQINKAFQKAAEGKLTMGSAGNLAFVPYVDEL